jgi:hypothetical protein
MALNDKYHHVINYHQSPVIPLSDRVAYDFPTSFRSICNLYNISANEYVIYEFNTSVDSQSLFGTFKSEISSMTRHMASMLDISYSTNNGIIVPIYPNGDFICFLCGHIISTTIPSKENITNHHIICESILKQKFVSQSCVICLHHIFEDHFSHHYYTTSHCAKQLLLYVGKKEFEDDETIIDFNSTNYFYNPYISIQQKYVNIHFSATKLPTFMLPLTYDVTRCGQLTKFLTTYNGYFLHNTSITIHCRMCSLLDLDECGIEPSVLLVKFGVPTKSKCLCGRDDSLTVSHLDLYLYEMFTSFLKNINAICNIKNIDPPPQTIIKTNSSSVDLNIVGKRTSPNKSRDTASTIFASIYRYNSDKSIRKLHSKYGSNTLNFVWKALRQTPSKMYRFLQHLKCVYFHPKFLTIKKALTYNTSLSSFLMFFFFREQIVPFNTNHLSIDSYKNYLVLTSLDDTILYNGVHLIDLPNFSRYFSPCHYLTPSTAYL